MNSMEEQGNLVSQQGEIHFTITITRADTGKVETYDLVGTPDEFLRTAEAVLTTEDKKDGCYK
jgi:hypothetical protein